MKLLLTSAGLANETIKKAFFELVEISAKEIKLAFIPTASNIEDGDKNWLIKDLGVLQDLSFGQIDIVDISALPQDVWQSRLEEANVLLFYGGNPVYLMYWIKKSGLKEILPKLLQSRIWFGISAGSMVTGVSILNEKDRRAASEIVGKDLDTKALGLVDFSLKPHYLSPLFEGRDKVSIVKEAENYEETIYTIDDNSAIMMDGDKIEVVSEGKWEKFDN